MLYLWLFVAGTFTVLVGALAILALMIRNRYRWLKAQIALQHGPEAWSEIRRWIKCCLDHSPLTGIRSYRQEHLDQVVFNSNLTGSQVDQLFGLIERHPVTWSLHQETVDRILFS